MQKSFRVRPTAGQHLTVCVASRGSSCLQPSPPRLSCGCLTSAATAPPSEDSGPKQRSPVCVFVCLNVCVCVSGCWGRLHGALNIYKWLHFGSSTLSFSLLPENGLRKPIIKSLCHREINACSCFRPLISIYFPKIRQNSPPECDKGSWSLLGFLVMVLALCFCWTKHSGTKIAYKNINSGPL